MSDDKKSTELIGEQDYDIVSDPSIYDPEKWGARPDITPPLVSCIMLTCWPERQLKAHAAIRSFLMQTWEPRELVIINSSYRQPHEYRLLEQEAYDLPAKAIREVMVEKTSHMTVGDLRNLGLEASAGEWFTSWDDDDWSHPHRLEAIMERRQTGLAIVPAAHVRYNIQTNTAYVYENANEGCANIAVFPRSDKRFPPLIHQVPLSHAVREKGEDAVYLQEIWKGRYVVWQNRSQAHHYLRFFHGNNVCQKMLVMRRYTHEWYDGVWCRDPREEGYMEVEHTEYLKHVLKSQYNLPVDGKPWNPKSEEMPEELKKDEYGDTPEETPQPTAR